jgi:hypothetical protein
MRYLAKQRAALTDRAAYIHFFKTLKYSLYVISHPLDGFWDLTHEKRGSIAAANFMVLMTVLTSIWELRFTSFLFCQVYWENVKIYMLATSVLFPILVWCVGNWGLTTLFDGKGTLKHIYMGTAYALTPYVLVKIPLIFFSNIVTVEEGAFYIIFYELVTYWVGFLLIAAMMQIHEYTLSKTILFTIATIFAMLVIIFILLLFFSLVSDGIVYFISLYRELVFRLY